MTQRTSVGKSQNLEAASLQAVADILHMTAQREHLVHALELVMAVTGAAAARVWWRVRGDFPLHHWVSVHVPPPEPWPIPTPDGAWAPVWEGERRVLPLRREDLPTGVLPAEFGEVHTEAWALIPSGTRARGAVLLCWQTPPASLPESHRELLRAALSAFTAQVWWRERWAQRKLERELLDETGRLLAQSFGREEVLGKIFELLGRVVRYDAGGIFLIDREHDEVGQIVEVGYASDRVDELHLKIGQGLVGHVAKTGEIVNVPDVARDPRYVNARPATRSALVVPVEFQKRRLGVLNLECDRLAAYDPNDEWLVESFAHQVAIALDRAELFDQQIEARRLGEQVAVARTIQRSFLPQRAPSIPGYDICGANFPSEQVGGDYFDFVPIVEGQWGFAIADVSGKGIPAALIMAGFRASLIAEIRNNYAIRTIFRKVNNVLREMTSQDNFVTAFYGVLDTQNRIFTFANAGHNPPLLLRAAGGVEGLREGGPLVGVIQDAQYNERPVWLGAGDVLILFTDGATEASSPSGEQFGERRLIELVQSARAESASTICRRIHDAVHEFAVDGHPADDITLVIIKVNPE